MPRNKQQFEEIRNQKIELIERVALQCFAKKGFHNTSIETIAKEAGISTGLTYNYFSSKDELLKTIYLKGINKVFSNMYDEKLSKEKFIAFIEHIFNEVQSNHPFWKLYFIVMSQPEILEGIRENIIAALTPMLNSITDYFDSRGIPNPDIEAQYLLSKMDGICINYLMNDKGYPLEKIKEKFLKNYV